jgi:hypothetical protein
MNAKLLIPLIAATLFSLPAYALDCSGGANGGMDVTGNQCNDPVVAATPASFESVATPPPAGASNAAAKQASHRSEGASLKHAAATRPASARSKSRHS